MNKISARSVRRPLDRIGIDGRWDYPPALGRKSWPQRQKWFADYVKAIHRREAAGCVATRPSEPGDRAA
jgi:hypothetical protein